MSSSPAQLQLSPARSPSLSAAFPRSPSRDTPTTPPAASACAPHAPPTPPDSLSRAAQTAALSPHSSASPDPSSSLSLSDALSASATQLQTRILDTPIDLRCLAPELDSPIVSQDTILAAERDYTAPLTLEHNSPTPASDIQARKPLPDTLPPPFIPAAAREQIDRENLQADMPETPSPDSRPPNVYINGLPPNFPEEDLLAMTRPFGAVLSVRTFTRHVSDKPSGYGFVLFERYAAAEKCIEALRKYRNLHPSFSKQVHKIPGTAYASVPSTNNVPADSFKAKMEQLGDTASTNLYMEGLPMSITEETLRALVTPYRIMSFRFFQTRLSHPPRIIAFVRFESRTAAEDIVERLHGRLVRGWNDTGCRISVRFADTAEQRELRRNERQTRDGEQSPARLTMARAALLNLKGTQYQSTDLSPTMSDISLPSVANAGVALTLNQLGLGQLGGQISPLSANSPLVAQDPFVADRPGLEALGVNIPGIDSLNARSGAIPAPNLRLPPGNNAALLENQAELQLALMGVQGLRARAQNGYTPVEQLILQAHARQQRAVGSNAESLQVRSPNVASGPTLGSSRGTGVSHSREVNRRLLDYLPQVSEDDFHATGGLLNSQKLAPRVGGLGRGAFCQGSDAVTSLALDLERQGSLSAGQPTRQRNHTLATQGRQDLDHQAAHIRASTLPSQYLDIRNQSNIANIPLYDSTVSLSHPGPTNNPLIHPNNASLTNNVRITSSKHISIGPSNKSSISNGVKSTSLPDTQTLFASKNNINVPSAASRNVMNATASQPTTLSSASSTNVTKNSGSISSNVPSDNGIPGLGNADEDDSSPVVSPALTYSTRTPASLSPATPYSGFFADGGETFKNSGISLNGAAIGVADLRLVGGEIPKTSGDRL